MSRADMLQEPIELVRKALQGAEGLGRLGQAGITVGTTPKEEVYREDTVTLYRYRPLVEQPLAVPVLIVYALINRYYMIDLQEDRSLVRRLLALGIDVYVIDWGYPRRGDRWLTLDDYIDGFLATCVDVVRARHGLPKITILGICQGGVFSLCYSALYPEKVKNLITMVTPVDFDRRDSLVNVWAKDLDVDALVDALGNVPGEFVSFGFLMRNPFREMIQKYVDLLDIVDDDDKLLTFLRMEKWIYDSPDQAGETFRAWIKDFYQANKLIKGQVEIGGRAAALHKVRMPVLNVYGEHDDIIPPASSQALGAYVGSSDYTVRSFPVGHIGMYVSSKVQKDLPQAIAGWLRERG